VTFKDFDAMLGEGRPDFTVGGQRFTARAKLPWKKFSQLILSMSAGGTDAASSDGIAKTEEFFRLVLIPSDRDRFMNLIANDGEEEGDEDNVIASQQVSAILDWLLGIYTGKLAATNGTPLLPSSQPTGEPSSTVSLNPLN
jgi:hypothetical protein